MYKFKPKASSDVQVSSHFVDYEGTQNKTSMDSKDGPGGSNVTGGGGGSKPDTSSGSPTPIHKSAGTVSKGVDSNQQPSGKTIPIQDNVTQIRPGIRAFNETPDESTSDSFTTPHSTETQSTSINQGGSSTDDGNPTQTPVGSGNPAPSGLTMQGSMTANMSPITVAANLDKAKNSPDFVVSDWSKPKKKTHPATPIVFGVIAIAVIALLVMKHSA